ncbi:MAG: PDZ domain-containing protein [Thermoguttaceae bacterium]
MRTLKKFLLLAFAPVLLTALVFANQSEEAEKKAPEAAKAQNEISVVQPELAKKLQLREKMPEYYLGVLCLPVPEVFAAHLGLEDYGMFIEALAPGGPADKAGIEVGDIILTFAGKNVVGVEDLFSVINADKDKEQAITILHKGKKVEKTIKPEKRPEAPSNLQGPSSGVIRNIRPGIIFEGKEGVDPRQIIRQFIEQIDENGAELEFMEENDTFGFGSDPSENKAERLQVTILPGDEPGTQKIHVRANDKTWDVNSVEELPEELQHQVSNAIKMQGMMHAMPKIGLESSIVDELNKMHTDIRSEMKKLDTDFEKAYENAPELKEKMQSFIKNIEEHFENLKQPKTEKNAAPVHDASVNKVS